MTARHRELPQEREGLEELLVKEGHQNSTLSAVMKKNILSPLLSKRNAPRALVT